MQALACELLHLQVICLPSASRRASGLASNMPVLERRSGRPLGLRGMSGACLFYSLLDHELISSKLTWSVLTAWSLRPSLALSCAARTPGRVPSSLMIPHQQVLCDTQTALKDGRTRSPSNGSNAQHRPRDISLQLLSICTCSIQNRSGQWRTSRAYASLCHSSLGLLVSWASHALPVSSAIESTGLADMLPAAVACAALSAPFDDDASIVIRNMPPRLPTLVHS